MKLIRMILVLCLILEGQIFASEAIGYYTSGKLKMLQGNVLDQTKDKFYECRY
jgi:hypothetical protein